MKNGHHIKLKPLFNSVEKSLKVYNSYLQGYKRKNMVSEEGVQKGGGSFRDAVSSPAKWELIQNECPHDLP